MRLEERPANALYRIFLVAQTHLDNVFETPEVLQALIDTQCHNCAKA